MPKTMPIPTVLIALAAACGDSGLDPITDLPRELSTAEADLINADNRFAFTLFRAINDDADPDDNLFVSPLSVAMALGMTLNGAAGDTRTDMQQALELGGLTEQQVNESYRSVIDLLRGLDPSVEFELANSIWYRQEFTFEQAFLDVNQTYFDAVVQALDFASADAAATINAWVSDRTRGRIEEIVDAPIPTDVIMYLINAIYFKGAWTYTFDPANTRAAAFRRADGSESTVDMMSQADLPVLHARVNDVQVLDLSYGGGAYRMTIVLPDEPAGIADVVDALTLDRWDTWTGALDSTELLVGLPRFRLEYGLGLKDVLSDIGMESAFCDSGVADFSRLLTGARPGEVCITRVKHKTFVEVNEEGTEAAAVTSVEIGLTSAPLPLFVDHPFLFAIRERLTGTILFMGRVMDPGA